MASIPGVVAGGVPPRWQVQHVTTWRPPKLSLLILFITSTICRATSFRGGSFSHCGLEPPAPTWQSPQHTFRAAENRPMVPMNSSTVRPFRTFIFLKTSSAICGLACAKATPPAKGNAAPSHATAPRTIHARFGSFIAASPCFFPRTGRENFCMQPCRKYDDTYRYKAKSKEDHGHSFIEEATWLKRRRRCTPPPSVSPRRFIFSCFP